VRGRLESDDGAARGVYAKVYMKLGEVLEGDFFSGYIKQGVTPARPHFGK